MLYQAPVYDSSMRLSLCGARVSLFVWRACVVLFCVARVCCALLSAASARPAGKPPAKRLGKHRASRPSGGGILEKKYLNFEVFFRFKGKKSAIWNFETPARLKKIKFTLRA